MSDRTKGFFAQRGIAVQIQGTPNSVTQMTDFSLGKFDIAMTAVDNIVAYVEGQGEAPIGPQPDFIAVMGSDSGFLSLVTSPSIKRIAELAGKTLSVDAMTTGYAFVLYEIMRRNGLDKDRGDYEIVRAGGMAQRWNGLREGGHAATLLSAPYNIIAKNHGFTELVKSHRRDRSLSGQCRGGAPALGAAKPVRDHCLYRRLPQFDCMAL